MKENEWISVKDMLPKKDGNSQIMCLVYDKYYNTILLRPYNEHHEVWDDEDMDDFYTDGVNGNITHWMPLPKRPQN